MVIQKEEENHFLPANNKEQILDTEKLLKRKKQRKKEGNVQDFQ